MNYRTIAAMALLADACATVHADPASALGRVFGSFGAGVSQAAIAPLQNSQPPWVAIEPRSKEDCLSNPAV